MPWSLLGLKGLRNCWEGEVGTWFAILAKWLEPYLGEGVYLSMGAYLRRCGDLTIIILYQIAPQAFVICWDFLERQL